MITKKHGIVKKIKIDKEDTKEKSYISNIEKKRI